MEVKIRQLIDGIFRVKRFLGAGASGKVYLVSLNKDWGIHKKGTLFALKCYSDEIFEREKQDVVYARRVRETAIGNKVNSTNVIKTFDTSDFWIDKDKPQYLLMEFIKGKQLDLWVKNNPPLLIDRIYDIALQIAEGLYALHSKKIIHRDVKAANVIITPEGRLVLLDLGVVRPLQEGTITGSESFLGTLRYGAPEWLIEGDYSKSADVYSLGTIFYLLLNGHDIFPQIDLWSRLVIAVERDLPQIHIESSEPQRAYLLQLVSKMLDKTPSNRPSLKSVIQFLKSYQTSNECVQFRKNRILELLPYLKSDFNRDNIIQILTAQTDIKKLDIALASFDKSTFYKLAGIDVMLAEISSLTTSKIQYLSLSEKKRVAWVKKAFAVMDAVNGWDDGSNIENKWHFASRISEVETSHKVLTQIRPILDNAGEAMTEMIQVFAQENPAD